MQSHPTLPMNPICTPQHSRPAPRSPRGKGVSRRLAAGFAAAIALAGVASAANTPRLRLNGVTAADNSAIAHATVGGPLTIDLRGTPNALFALLVATESNGALNGFFLKPSTGPSPLVPIHPVLDGIGTATIAANLGMPATAFVPDIANPAFHLGPDGRFVFSGRTPEEIALFDAANPGTPLVLPLESPPGGPDVALFLQVVEIDPISGSMNVGNGVRIVFDPLVFQGELSLALASQPASPTIDGEIGLRNSLVEISDPNLGVAGSPPPVVALDFALSPDVIDIYRIELAGIEPAMGASYWSAPATIDQDSATAQQYVQAQASGIDVGAGVRPVRNNDNPQYPSVELPGGRGLFHYRDVSTTPSRFGFGLHDASTGLFRDLVPPAFASFFANGASAISPFEYQVVVSPSGDRALVVLEVLGTASRLFLLDLVPGSTFSNGFPVVEIALPAELTRVFDESFAILDAADGTELCLFAATTAANPQANTLPGRLYAVAMQEGATPTLLLPGGANPAIAQVGRLPIVSKDRKVACLRAGTSTASQNVFAVRASSATGFTIVNCTGNLITSFSIAQWGNVTNGDFEVASITPDGAYLAFCTTSGPQSRPHVVKTDGSQAGSISPVAKYLTEGGLFDAADFGSCRALQLTSDGKYLVFALGFVIAGALGDRFDVFVVELATGTTRNLTRTIAGGSYLGPWDPQGDLTQTRPTIEIGGTFASPSGDWLYFFRERRMPATAALFDLVAISMASGPGGAPPSFDLVNVTGDEFPPSFGAPPQVVTSPATTLGGSFINDPGVGGTRLRRFPSGHPLAGQMVFGAMLASLSGPTPAVLLSFDAEQPAAATTLATVPIPSGGGLLTRITDIAIDPLLPRVAFVADGDGLAGGAPNPGLGQDLFVADAATPGPAASVTSSGFALAITAGSTRFGPPHPYQESGILFAAGSATPSVYQIDAFVNPSIASNPIDADLFFHRFAIGSVNPAVTVPVLAPIPPGNRRAMFLWSVR